MSTLVKRIDAAFYPEYRQNWDDTLFREAILQVIQTEHCVLDLGSGGGGYCPPDELQGACI
jgi:hypothetical protein